MGFNLRYQHWLLAIGLVGAQILLRKTWVDSDHASVGLVVTQMLLNSIWLRLYSENLKRSLPGGGSCFTTEKARKKRQLQLRDKTANVWVFTMDKAPSALSPFYVTSPCALTRVAEIVVSWYSYGLNGFTAFILIVKKVEHTFSNIRTYDWMKSGWDEAPQFLQPWPWPQTV